MANSATKNITAKAAMINQTTRAMLSQGGLRRVLDPVEGIMIL
jgi:hypothetical protein